MATLEYTTVCSLDGYVADAAGNFDWAEPDAEVHAFVNDRERSVGTYLYGRRLYETMRVWQEEPLPFGGEPVVDEYATIWRAADKIVWSTTLPEVTTPRTTLRRRVDPAEVTAVKQAATAPLGVGGATLAATFLRAGLVDAIGMYLVPVVVGGGLRALPHDVRLDLDLQEVHRFAGGTVFLRHAVR